MGYISGVLATFCFFLELCSRWAETPVDCEYDDRGDMDEVVAFFETFSMTFRDPAEDASGGTSGVSGEAV